MKGFKRELRVRPKITKLDLILGSLLFIAIFFSDVLQNKLLDVGIDYQVTWFEGIKSNALTLWYISIFLLFLFFLIMMLKSVLLKQNRHVLDIIVGSLGILSIAFLYGMTMVMVLAPNVLVPVITPGIKLLAISVYHIGIALVLLSATYFVVFE